MADLSTAFLSKTTEIFMLLLILVLQGCSGYDDAGICAEKMEDFLVLQLCVNIFQLGSKVSKADWSIALNYLFQ